MTRSISQKVRSLALVIGALTWTAGAQPRAHAAANSDQHEETSCKLPERKGPDIVITTYGSGRRGSVALPKNSESIVPIPTLVDLFGGGPPDVIFPFDDYTHLATGSADRQTRLEPGEYTADLVPWERRALIVEDEPNFPTGSSGAVILRPKDLDRPPILVHSGEPSSESFARVPALLMSGKDLDRLIGSLATLRTGLATETTWANALNRLQGSPECRSEKLRPFSVTVATDSPPWLGSFKAPYYGKRLAPIPAATGLELAGLVSPERLERARFTAGMTPLEYVERLRLIAPSVDNLSGEVKRIASSGGTPESRRRQFLQLSNDAKSLVIQMDVLLEGLLMDASTEQFVNASSSWKNLIAMLDKAINDVRSLSEDELAPILASGDAGGKVSSMWPASSTVSPAETCALDPVELTVPQIEVPIGSRKLLLGGSARFWFIPAPGKPSFYRLYSAFRLNAEPVRKIHRETAAAFVREKFAHSCSERNSLSGTDEAVSANGDLILRTTVRSETWQCAYYRYPCGISLTKVKMCEDSAKTRLFSFTIGKKTPVRTGVEAGKVYVDLDLLGARGRFGGSDVSAFGSLVETTGLSPSGARFLEWNNQIWHASEWRGREVNKNVACLVAEVLKEGT